MKKFPLNFAVSDESLIVSNPRLVDVNWEVDYVLSSKNLNKLFEHRFKISMTFLTQMDQSLQQGVSSYFPYSAKRNNLKLRKVEFYCD